MVVPGATSAHCGESGAARRGGTGGEGAGWERSARAHADGEREANSSGVTAPGRCDAHRGPRPGQGRHGRRAREAGRPESGQELGGAAVGGASAQARDARDPDGGAEVGAPRGWSGRAGRGGPGASSWSSGVLRGGKLSNGGREK